MELWLAFLMTGLLLAYPAYTDWKIQRINMKYAWGAIIFSVGAAAYLGNFMTIIGAIVLYAVLMVIHNKGFLGGGDVLLIPLGWLWINDLYWFGALWFLASLIGGVSFVRAIKPMQTLRELNSFQGNKNPAGMLKSQMRVAKAFGITHAYGAYFFVASVGLFIIAFIL